MTKKFILQANKRQHSASATRSKDSVPAILYGHGIETQNIAIDIKEFIKLYHDAGSTSLVSLHINGGEEHPVLIREVQYHPVRSQVLHIDFYQINMDEEIRADVPLIFTGEAPAVRDAGGTLVRNMDQVDLSALPVNLPHDIEVDISILDNFEKVIRVADLKLPEGVELHHEDNDVIALVQAPKTQEQVDAELAEEITEDVEAVEGVADADEASDEETSEEDKPAEKEESTSEEISK